MNISQNNREELPKYIPEINQLPANRLLELLSPNTCTSSRADVLYDVLEQWDHPFPTLFQPRVSGILLACSVASKIEDVRIAPVDRISRGAPMVGFALNYMATFPEFDLESNNCIASFVSKYGKFTVPRLIEIAMNTEYPLEWRLRREAFEFLCNIDYGAAGRVLDALKQDDGNAPFTEFKQIYLRYIDEPSTYRPRRELPRDLEQSSTETERIEICNAARAIFIDGDINGLFRYAGPSDAKIAIFTAAAFHKDPILATAGVDQLRSLDPEWADAIQAHRIQCAEQ